MSLAAVPFRAVTRPSAPGPVEHGPQGAAAPVAARRLLILLAMLAALLMLLVLQPARAASATDTLKSLAGSQDEFLPVEQAFVAQADLLDDTVLLKFRIAPGYYLYRSKFRFEARGATLAEPQLPDGTLITDEYFGEQVVYYTFAEIRLPLATPARDFELQVKFQGCADAGLCYAPVTQTLKIGQGAPASDGAPASTTPGPGGTSPNQTAAGGDTPAKDNTANPDTRTPGTNASDSSDGGLTAALQAGNILLAAGLAVLAGLALTFTPCVLPMVPIVVAMAGGQTGTRRTLWLTFLYVQATAVVYALLGVAVASAGAALTGALQSPWLLWPGVALFLLFAAAMFGAFELRLPAVLQTRLSDAANQRHGSATGALLTGAISALIVSPCVSAPLASVLVWIAQSGDQLLGAVVLYALAIGMGLPLLLVAGGGARLLPRSGVWLEQVKHGFGFGLLAVAIVLANRLLPAPVGLALWAGLMLALSVYFAGIRPASAWAYLFGALRMAALVFGLALLIGALTGQHNPLRPLDGLARADSAAAPPVTGNDRHAGFVKVKTVADVEAAVARAGAAGQTVMLDFYADWCVACFEFADYTFPAPAVQAQTRHMLLLQADVSANDADDRALLQHYAVLGLPTILLFDRQGRELSDARVTGFLDAERFSAHLQTRLDPACQAQTTGLC